ncbi:MAG TPA: hypothetical protein VLA99_18180 [Nitrospiraceae bacterium]|nr:hypothetical protein [Nitrospiraceae bacterium]
MDTYDIHLFSEQLRVIENLLLEMAAAEDELLTLGLQHVADWPSYEAAKEPLEDFAENFISLKRYAGILDHASANELDSLDASTQVVEQVSAIRLHLRIAAKARRRNPAVKAFSLVLLHIPYVSGLVKSKGLFSEEQVPLQKTIVGLSRLRSLTKVIYDLASYREYVDSDLFKPSNVEPDRVLHLIEAALHDIENSVTLSASERESLKGYLAQAQIQLASKRPTWSTIVGALAIACAISSGIADAPGAAKNLRDAFEYIMGTSVTKPVERLPPPTLPKLDDNPMSTLG